MDNIDVLRHILSFLPVHDYLRSKLICKSAVSKEQEDRIIFFKNELFKVIPKKIFVMGKKCYNTRQNLYNVLLSKNQLDFFCEEKWLTPELKKKIKKITNKKVIFRENKTFTFGRNLSADAKTYHFLLF